MHAKRRRTPGAIALVLAGWAVAAPGPRAAVQDGNQTGALYPVYEGFATNADGTHTLVFGYYNGSPVEVSIPPGEANRFLPGPADRGQPTTFLPGRQRNICRIVVPSDFSVNLQWLLRSGDVATATSERGGVSQLYLLEQIGAAYRAARDLDPDQVPRGVCVNRAPLVRAPGQLAIATGEELALEALVQDDGLPRDATLSAHWSVLEGPGEVHFGDPSATATSASFAVPGSYRLRLTATDSELERSVEITVTVNGSSGR